MSFLLHIHSTLVDREKAVRPHTGSGQPQDFRSKGINIVTYSMQ